MSAFWYRCSFGLLVSTLFYIGAICGIVYMYRSYASRASCSLNIFFIAWTAILLAAILIISLNSKVHFTLYIDMKHSGFSFLVFFLNYCRFIEVFYPLELWLFTLFSYVGVQSEGIVPSSLSPFNHLYFVYANLIHHQLKIIMEFQ